MNGETAGPVIGTTGLTAFAGAVVAVKAGVLDGLISAVTPMAVVVAVAAAAVALAGRSGGGGRATSGRMVAGHAHGPSRTIARHEAGHAAAARALGGQVVSATADRHGGYVHATLPNNDPRAAIAFWLAGRRAAGTGAGCSADDALIRNELRTVPRGERAQVRRDADRAARRIVRQHGGQIRRDAQKLEQRGQL